MTAKLIMKNKSFASAETLLPNNKIKFWKIPDNVNSL